MLPWSALRGLGVALVGHGFDGHRELLLQQLVGVALLRLVLLGLGALVRDLTLHLLQRVEDACDTTIPVRVFAPRSSSLVLPFAKR